MWVWLLVALHAQAAPLPAAGLQVMEEAHCVLCHEVPEVTPVPQLESCADCHAWIRDTAADPVKRARAQEVFPYWDRYERNVATYLPVPNLQAAMARLEPEWVGRYLADPYDLRPHLPETMPRFDLEPAELSALVEVFAAAQVVAPPSPDPEQARVGQGAALFAERGCPACHTLGGLYEGPGLPVAPDLANTRDRMNPDLLLLWLQDPSAVSSSATMPATGLDAAEALALRDYLLLVPLEQEPAPPLTATLPTVARPVTYAEVEERVFGKICVHCHMDPAQNAGRAGPGNAGGFGWAATGLELQTYEGVLSALDRIPEALMRRRSEAHRDAVEPGHRPASLTRPPKPGMPLGLPPLPDEDIALVLAWIQQGAPR